MGSCKAFLCCIVMMLVCLSEAFQSFFNSRIYSHSGAKNRAVNLQMVAKFDPETFVRVSCEKPFGLDLDEVEVDAPRGVTVAAVDPTGNGKISGVRAGLFLVSVAGVDVKYKDFDAILEIIGAAESPVDLGK